MSMMVVCVVSKTAFQINSQTPINKNKTDHRFHLKSDTKSGLGWLEGE